MRRFEVWAAVTGLAAAVACGGKDKGETPRGATPAEMASSAATADSESTRGSTGRAVLFLGTSLTAGYGLDADSAYPQQIQRLIAKAALPFHAVNGGVSGETSAGLMRRLEWVLQQPAALIVIETGANDGLRGQSVEATKETIRQIIARIKKEHPEARVVLAQMEAPPNLGADYTRAFHAMFPALASETGVVLMPFLLEGVAGHPSLNQGDGIHPNFEGERMVTSTVWKTIGPILDTLSRTPKP